MKILFTSDMHGEERASGQFGRLLAGSDYDIRIIAGDLQEECFTKNELMSILRLKEDDLREELVSADPPEDLAHSQSRHARYVRAAMELQAKRLKELIAKSGKRGLSPER